MAGLPVGVRNNNPGNLRINPANKWQGKVTPSRDRRFETFETPVFGIRALAVLLIKYFDRDGLHTVRSIINKYAPTEENPTANYASHVAGRMGVAVDDPLDLHEYATIMPMVVGIIAFENAGYAYPQATVDAGLAMAGVTVPGKAVIVETPKPLARDPRVLERVGTAVGTGILAVPPALEGISSALGGAKQVKDQASDLVSGEPNIMFIVGAVLLIVCVAFGLYRAFAHRAKQADAAS